MNNSSESRHSNFSDSMDREIDEPQIERSYDSLQPEDINAIKEISFRAYNPAVIDTTKDEISYRALKLADRLTSQEPYNLDQVIREDFPEKNKFAHIVNTTSNKSSIQRSSTAQDINVQEKPSVLLPCHFNCFKDILDILYIVTKALESNSRVCFEIDPKILKWNGSFCRGTTFCKFEFNVYNGDSANYIFEGNRLKGDACAFYEIYRFVKANLLSEEIVPTEPLIQSAPKSPDSETDISDDMIQEALLPIKEMATSDCLELKVEAAKILNYLSTRDETIDSLREMGMIDVLGKLLLKGCECTQRNAALALTNMSEAQSCQEAILNSDILLELFDRCVDGSYVSSETRRSCARVLANISARLGTAVANRVGTERLKKWMTSIDSIKDAKLLVQANRAKYSLQEAIKTA